jgi:hypothetical protein
MTEDPLEQFPVDNSIEKNQLLHHRRENSEPQEILKILVKAGIKQFPHDSK